MRKIALVLSLLLISTYSFATANFTSGTGVFVVPDVSVDGTKNYKSVTLQLNFANNTFTILDATEKDTSFSPTALDSITGNGLKAEFYGCARSGHNQITCLTKIVSTTVDQKMTLNLTFNSGYSYPSQLFDDLGKEYKATVSALDKSDRSLVINLIQGVPVEVKFVFDDIDIQAKSISAFKPHFTGDSGVIEGNFRNISF
ncbi:MAG: hypothetical protein WAU15_00430 [Nitrosomonas sp.]